MNARQNERQEFAVLHARSMWSAMKNINESGRSSLCIVITVSFFLREMKFRDLRFHKEFADFFAESFTLDSDDQKQAASEATTRIAKQYDYLRDAIWKFQSDPPEATGAEHWTTMEEVEDVERELSPKSHLNF